VEDNRGDALLLRRSLIGRLPVLHLLHFQTGHALFERLANVDPGGLPDLILLDINLPVMSGHEILRRLQLTPEARNIPVIMLSSSSAEHDISHAYSSGACGYLVKPLSITEYEYLANGIAGVWNESGFSCDPSVLAGVQGYRKPLAA
jgi:CheY-like chemotaxis protein